MSFTLSMFAAVAVQKNIRDLANSTTEEEHSEETPGAKEGW
jgi:hypothetical protein